MAFEVFTSGLLFSSCWSNVCLFVSCVRRCCCCLNGNLTPTGNTFIWLDFCVLGEMNLSSNCLRPVLNSVKFSKIWMILPHSHEISSFRVCHSIFWIFFRSFHNLHFFFWVQLSIRWSIDKFLLIKIFLDTFDAHKSIAGSYKFLLNLNYYQSICGHQNSRPTFDLV